MRRPAGARPGANPGARPDGRPPLGRGTAATLAALTLAALTACGSGGDGVEAAASSGGCATTGVSSKQIHLGLLSSSTGGSADQFNGFRSGVDARIGLANAAGGVGGRQITYSWADDKSETAINSAVARTLVESDQSFAVLEATRSASGSSAYLSKAGVPVVGLAGDTSWAGRANMVTFANEGSAQPAASTVGEFVRAVGGTTAAVYSLPFRDSYRDARQATAASLTAAGVRVAVDGQVTAATNFAQLAADLKAARVDTIAANVDQANLTRIVEAARAAGVNPKVVVSPAGYDQRLINLYGPQLAGLYLYLDFRPYDIASPGGAIFARAMAAYAPELNPPVSQGAMWGWISADLAVRGLSAAGSCPSREGFLRALKGMKNYDAGGMLTRPVNLATAASGPNLCYQIVQVKPDGSGYAPFGSGPRCGRSL